MIDFEKEIEKIKKQIIQKFSPRKIILFGSAAKGEIREDSDIDLFIIWETDLELVERLNLFNKSISGNLPLDMLVYTPEEFNNAVRKKHPFALDLQQKGKVLYG